MAKDKGWIVYPLEDKKVNELVLPRRHVVDLRKLSREQKELTGLLYGVPRENSLYLVGYLQLGEGTRTECGFNEDYRWFQNELATRIKKPILI